MKKLVNGLTFRLVQVSYMQMEKEKVEILFRKYYKPMYVKAYGILGDDQESKDVVGDVFSSLLERDFCPAASTEGQYLLATVRHRCLNRLRDRSNRERMAKLYVDSQDEGSETDDDGLLRQLRDFAHKCLSQLEFDIFTMRFVEGMEYNEICQRTGFSRVAVWKHLSHIVKLLKEQFNPLEL